MEMGSLYLIWTIYKWSRNIFSISWWVHCIFLRTEFECGEKGLPTEAHLPRINCRRTAVEEVLLDTLTCTDSIELSSKWGTLPHREGREQAFLCWVEYHVSEPIYQGRTSERGTKGVLSYFLDVSRLQREERVWLPRERFRAREEREARRVEGSAHYTQGRKHREKWSEIDCDCRQRAIIWEMSCDSRVSVEFCFLSPQLSVSLPSLVIDARIPCVCEIQFR